MDEPLALLVDVTLAPPTTGPDGENMDTQLGLSPLPVGLDVQKGNRDRRFKLLTSPGILPISRKEIPMYQMNLMSVIFTSNMGVNEVRERKVVNFVQALRPADYLADVLWIVPQDILPMKAVLVMLLEVAIGKQLRDQSLIR